MIAWRSRHSLNSPKKIKEAGCPYATGEISVQFDKKINIFAIMMKQAIILFFILIGLFLPKITSACDAMSTASMETMSCCKEHNHIVAHQDEGQKSDCSDNGFSDSNMANGEHQCPNNGCNCPTSINSLFIAATQVVKQPEYHHGKYCILYTTPSLPNGFYTIWLPPKIS